MRLGVLSQLVDVDSLTFEVISNSPGSFEILLHRNLAALEFRLGLHVIEEFPLMRRLNFRRCGLIYGIRLSVFKMRVHLAGSVYLNFECFGVICSEVERWPANHHTSGVGVRFSG